MLRSMYSGISGMKANQTKMDVVGNNVANVGTTAYKKTGARFSDALYQTAIYASTPGGGLGGVNPGQIGIGTKVSGIFRNMVQGAIQPTGRVSDLAIDGDGFFSVKIADNQIAYTRDGSFSLDKDGYIVTAEGYKVLGSEYTGGKIDPEYNQEIQVPKEVEFVEVEVEIGTGADKKTVKAHLPINENTVNYKDGKPEITGGKYTIKNNAKVIVDGEVHTVKADQTIEEKNTIMKKVLTFNISKTGEVSYVLNDGTKYPELDKNGKLVEGAIQQKLQIGVFQNPEGLEALGGNLYGISANSGEPIKTNSYGQINQGAIEMSNVDLSEEFTEMIVAQRGFQANTRIITTSDEILQELVNLKR